MPSNRASEAAARCRSAIFKPRVVELSEHTAALRDEFRAHERKDAREWKHPLNNGTSSRTTIGDLIRRVFVDLGSNVPARTVTQFIIDGKLLPAEMKRALLFRGLNDHVRRELARITIEGLPFAQPTGTKKQSPWKQLDLFTRDEAHAPCGDDCAISTRTTASSCGCKAGVSISSVTRRTFPTCLHSSD